MNPPPRVRRRLAALRTVARRRRNRTLATLQQRRFGRRNRVGRDRVTGQAPVVVSMTSFGRRVADVHLAVESIAAGSTRPHRLLLWLDDAALVADPPPALSRLRARGLEILLADDLGPHKKYFPYAEGATPHSLPLVTADDDVFYPRRWLEGLVRSYDALPGAVHCYRANVVVLGPDGLAAYKDWPRCRTTRPSLTHFATGVSGVLYPPAMLDDLARRGAAFRASAPRADDVWLHWVALQNRLPVRQVGTWPRHFPSIPGSQESSLTHSNVHQDGNDVQLRTLYRDTDVAALRTASAGG